MLALPILPFCLVGLEQHAPPPKGLQHHGLAPASIAYDLLMDSDRLILPACV